MSETALLEDEILVVELYRLGIKHLSRLVEVPAQPMQPAQLIAALAQHPASRFSASLILLFLRHPEYSASVSDALTLKLYYQAAAYLQREFHPLLRAQLGQDTELPDLLSQELGTPSPLDVERGTSCQGALAILGEVHRQRSGWDCNWAGSYRQHIPLLLRYGQRQARCPVDNG